jgi:hypothetical protein
MGENHFSLHAKCGDQFSYRNYIHHKGKSIAASNKKPAPNKMERVKQLFLLNTINYSAAASAAGASGAVSAGVSATATGASAFFTTTGGVRRAR